MKIKIGSQAKDRRPQRYENVDPYAGFPFDEEGLPWDAIIPAVAGAILLIVMLLPWK